MILRVLDSIPPFIELQKMYELFSYYHTNWKEEKPQQAEKTHNQLVFEIIFILSPLSFSLVRVIFYLRFFFHPFSSNNSIVKSYLLVFIFTKNSSCTYWQRKLTRSSLYLWKKWIWRRWFPELYTTSIKESSSNWWGKSK